MEQGYCSSLRVSLLDSRFLIACLFTLIHNSLLSWVTRYQCRATKIPTEGRDLVKKSKGNYTLKISERSWIKAYPRGSGDLTEKGALLCTGEGEEAAG